MGIESPVHLVFIAAVALIVLGPKRLPQLARALGQGIREFRGALEEGAVAPQPVAEPAPAAAAPPPASELSPLAAEPPPPPTAPAPVAAQPAPPIQQTSPTAELDPG